MPKVIVTTDLKTSTQVNGITGRPPVKLPNTAGVPVDATNPTNSVTGENTTVVYNPPLTKVGK